MVASHGDAGAAVKFRGWTGVVAGTGLQHHSGELRSGDGHVRLHCGLQRSESISVRDIFDFLTAWFAGNTAADVNNSGVLSVQDIFDFLGFWFAAAELEH